MTEAPQSRFITEPDPENPGWLTWATADPEIFNPQVMGKLIVRTEGEASCRLRMFPAKRHANVFGAVHGAVTLALIDITLFATVKLVVDADAGGSVTLELTNQFIGSARIGEPLDAVAEVLRETRRLVFLRGLVMQGDELITSFTGIVRKPPSR